MEEKKALNAKKDQQVTSVEIKTHNDRVTDLNRRIAEFHDRREAFRKDLNGFMEKRKK